MIRLVIADDHPLVREGISSMLMKHADIDVVAQASNGKEAVESTLRTKPDLLLLDLRMPDMNGPEVTRKVMAVIPDIKVLILTTYDTDSDILPAIEAGAHGYMLKDVQPAVLAEAIRKTVAGQTVLDSHAAQVVAEQLRPDAQVTLSEQEKKVLLLAADGKTNRLIAKELYISEATVKTYFNRIFAKLEVTDRTAAVAKMLRG